MSVESSTGCDFQSRVDDDSATNRLAKLFLTGAGREERVGQLLRERADELSDLIADAASLLDVHFIGSGCDHCVFRVAGSWGVRFPKRCESARWLRREHRLFDALSAQFASDGVAARVPVHRRCLAPSPAFPLPCVVYELLDGVAGHLLLQPAALPGLAASVAACLSAVHATPPPAELAQRAAGHDDWRPDVYRAVVRQDLIDAAVDAGHHCSRGEFDAAALLRALGMRDERLAQLAGGFFDERTYAAPAPVDEQHCCLLHGDLDPEHFFVDVERRQLAGIIDWSDARVADPARDLAALLSWGGVDFFADCMAAYSRRHQLDADVAARLLFLARACSIDAWFSTVGDDAALHASAEQMLRNVFSVELRELAGRIVGSQSSCRSGLVNGK